MRVRVKRLSGADIIYSEVSHTYLDEGLYVMKLRDGSAMGIPIANIDFLEEKKDEMDKNERQEYTGARI